MKLLSAAILLTAFCVVYAVDGIDPEPMTSSTTTSSTTTTATTPSTTSKVTSVTTSTTASTPTTSTTTTTTTTAAPTTPNTTTTTTVAPTTSTSTARPTETPTTVPPSPEPKPGTWEVTNSTNSSCILLKMVAELVVNFNGSSSNASQISRVIVPANANVNGSCGNATEKNQTMMLQWSYVNDTTNTMEFVFSKKDKKFELDMVYITLILDSIHFKNGSDQRLNIYHEKVDFVTPVDMSYKCEKEQTLNFKDVDSATNITASLKISQFQFQAFGNITNKHFADAKDCEPYETPDIVPIAVGCALMALIIIVLVGYLIGRRRNQARGYLSMVEE